jgi:hypothetical protein
MYGKRARVSYHCRMGLSRHSLAVGDITGEPAPLQLQQKLQAAHRPQAEAE